MKHVSFLSILLLLTSSVATAQDAPADPPAEAAPAEGAPAEAAPAEGSPVEGAPGETEPPRVEGDVAVEGEAGPGTVGVEATVAEPEPEVSEPEPEVSEPEPEVSEPEPEVSEPATGLGEADPSVETDVAEAAAEGEAPDEGAAGGGGGEEEGATSTADRLGDPNGGVGLPWTAPLTWTHNLSARTLNPAGQLTYNPTYSWSFSWRPRWIFGHGISIGARQDLDVELTDSNLTAENRQLWWGDTQLDATFPLPWRPGGFMFTPSVAVRLPTSQISRGQSRVLGMGGRLLVMRPVPVGNGLILGGLVSYNGWARAGGRRVRTGDDSTDIPGLGETPVAAPQCSTASQGGGAASSGADLGDTVGQGNACAGGPGTLDNAVTAVVFATLIATTRMSINMSMAWVWNFNSGLGEACVDTLSGPVCRGDNSVTKQNTLTSFSFSIGYDFKPYFTASVGYNTLSFFPDSDGGFENFIYNENTQFSLSFQFRPGALVAERMADARARRAAAGEDEEEVSEAEQAEQADAAVQYLRRSRL